MSISSASTASIPTAHKLVQRSSQLRFRVGSAALVLTVIVFGGLVFIKVVADQAVQRIWDDLESTPPSDQVFSPELVSHLPEPAQRYFLHSIRPGTPLASRVHLRQTGSIRLGSDWVPFSAEQLLTPRSFVWKASTRLGPLPITATDYYASDEGHMRVAALGLVPVVNETGADLTRSTIGRLAIEYMWLPSAWLPQANAEIESVDDDRFAVTVAVGKERSRLVLRVDADGRLLENSLPRYGNQAPDGRYQYIPFGGTIDAEETFRGYTIPTRIRMGWWYGTDQYAEEFRFEITSATFA